MFYIIMDFWFTKLCINCKCIKIYYYNQNYSKKTEKS